MTMIKERQNKPKMVKILKNEENKTMKNDSKLIKEIVELKRQNEQLKIENNLYRSQERLKKLDEQLSELQRSKEEKEFDLAQKMNDFLVKLMAECGLSQAAAFEKALADPEFRRLYDEYNREYQKKIGYRDMNYGMDI
jgi:hypothetical protein